MVLGSAAWNGVNFAMALYLFFSIAGFIGLFAGFCAAISRKAVISWLASMSALAILFLSVIFAFGFIFDRSPGVPFGKAFHAGLGCS